MPAKIPQEVREAQLSRLPGKTFIRWVGEYSGHKSRVVMRCCNGHEWEANSSVLINEGTGCPRCFGNGKYSKEHREMQLMGLKNKTFIRWVDGYRNVHSKALVRCSAGHEWEAMACNLLRGDWCPECSKKKHVPEAKRIDQINSVPGIRFVRWEFDYKNAFSKAILRCDNGHEWASAVAHTVNGGKGCPSCAKTGFDYSKPASVYFLISDSGGYIKVGISNAIKRRLYELSRGTPFGFKAIGIIRTSGHDAIDLEKTIHHSFESAGLRGFDGATEWLKYDPLIIDVLRAYGC